MAEAEICLRRPGLAGGMPGAWLDESMDVRVFHGLQVDGIEPPDV